jgi:DNA primase
MDAPWTKKGVVMTILELAQQTGLNPKWVAGTAGGEYHSACPMCSGRDRFYIQPFRQMAKCMGSYCCRQCGIRGDAIQFAREFLNLSFQDAAKTVNAIMTDLPSSVLFNRFRKQTTVLQKPPALWIEKSSAFVDQAHKNLLCKDDVLQYLVSRGLPLEAVQRYKIGWSDKNEFLSRSDWGLEEQISQEGKSRSLWIPKGIVIPTAQSNGEVIRLKVRRADYKQDDKLPKYVAISGSMNGLSLIGNTRNKIMIVVESELDAYAIDHATNDFAFVVAVGSNIKNPDNVTDKLAQKTVRLLICHDNDEAGKKMLIKWQKLYPHSQACPTPIGKDIGEAVKSGLNIRQWLQE